VFELLAQEKEAEVLVDFLLVRQRFGHFEDQSGSVLVALIFPLRLDSLAEKLNGVDAPRCPLDRIAEYEWILRFLFAVILEEEVGEGGNGGLRPEVDEVCNRLEVGDEVDVALVGFTLIDEPNPPL